MGERGEDATRPSFRVKKDEQEKKKRDSVLRFPEEWGTGQ